MTALAQTDTARMVHLGWRQIDVLGELISTGGSSRAIGKVLFITEDTVKCHIRDISKKTGTTGRTELAVSALRGDFLVIDPDGKRVRF